MSIEDEGVKLGPGEPKGLKINGVTVMKNDYLPPNFMMVSPDVYEMLTDTPEKAAERQAKLLGQVQALNQLIQIRGAKR